MLREHARYTKLPERYTSPVLLLLGLCFAYVLISCLTRLTAKSYFETDKPSSRRHHLLMAGSWCSDIWWTCAAIGRVGILV